MSESETNELQDLGQLCFKEEEIMKKIICCLIALVLCLGVLPVCAQEEAAMTAGYQNSIIYDVVSDGQGFIPDDFLKVECTKVDVLSMKQRVDGKYDYTLLLHTGITADEAIEILGDGARKNTYASDRELYENHVWLADDMIYVPLGERSCTHLIGWYGDAINDTFAIGVEFSVDPAVFDENVLKNKNLAGSEVKMVLALSEDQAIDDTLETNIRLSDSIAAGRLDNINGKISEAHRYLAVPAKEKTCGDLMEKLVGAPGVKNAEITFRKEHLVYVEGQMSANVVDKEIAEYLYRYEPANEYEEAWANRFTPFPYYEPNIDPVIWFEGKKVGTTKVNIGVGSRAMGFYGELEVIVYLKGDVNKDEKVEVDDALVTLQGSVKKVDLSEDQVVAAKFGKEGAVTATDALRVLKCAVDK